MPSAPPPLPRRTEVAAAVLSAAIALAAMVVAAAATFAGPTSLRPLGWRIRIGDAMRPLLIAAAADIALLVVAYKRPVARALAVVVAGAIVVLMVLSAARRTAPMHPVSDEALIELATINALEGQQLRGPYSRYPWHHPGPSFFYLLAPFYAASGWRTSGLAAAALLLNLAALGSAMWMLLRVGGAALTAAFAVLASLYVARVPAILVSSWNAHATILPSIALIIATSAVAAGHVRLLPVLALLASFVVQTHVALLPLAAITSAMAVLAVGWQAARGRVTDRATLSASANRAAWLLAVMWLLPVVEELGPGRGNLTALWEFGRQPQPTGDFARAIDAWAIMLTGIFQPNLSLPQGVLLTPINGLSPRIVAAVHLLALAAAVWYARRRGQGVQMWLALQSIVASLVALWAVTRIPDGIHDHETFWISAVGVAGAATILAAAVAVGLERWRPVQRSARLSAAMATLLLMAGALLHGLGQMAAIDARSRMTTAADDTVVSASRAIEAEMAKLGARRPLILIDQRVWDAAAGVILQLRKQGRPVTVEAGLVSMFAGTLAPDGSEDLEITFCGGPCHSKLVSRPGNIVVLLSDRIAVDARPLTR